MNEPVETTISIKKFFTYSIKQLKNVFVNRSLRKVVVSSSLFDGIFKTLKDYIQPILRDLILVSGIYMVATLEAATQLKIILGLIYGVMYIFSSMVSRNIYRLNIKFSSSKLMDLVRNKYLKIEEIQTGRKKDYKFILIESDINNLKKHESYLIHWLFYSVGNGESVTLKEIKTYAKASRTQSNFVHNYNSWVKKVSQEFKKFSYFGQSKEGLKTSIKVILIEFA
ncbi:unnamed protein product, partial [marine sediment metagenome]